MTDSRTNEPTEAMVEAAAKALQETRNPWFAAHGDWGAAGFEIKQAFRESARDALVAAHGAARPVNSFDTTVEREKNGADSLHVAPQEPNQNETKSGNNFVSLDPEKVAELIEQLRDRSRKERDVAKESLGQFIARALCEAYTEGKLT